jgi:hypothetical protein
VTSPDRNATEAQVVAARFVLQDAHDETIGLATMIEEAAGYMAEGGGSLAALGTLGDYEKRVEAIQALLSAARVLLMRARGGSR